MATSGRSGMVHTLERWPWVKELYVERVSEDRRARHGMAMRRSSTLVWGAILERGFEELISGIHSMIGAINSMQQRMTRQWRRVEDPEENRTPKRYDRRDQKG